MPADIRLALPAGVHNFVHAHLITRKQNIQQLEPGRISEKLESACGMIDLILGYKLHLFVPRWDYYIIGKTYLLPA